MDYFWRNKGFIYDPTKQGFLSQYHLILMGAIIIIAVLLWLLVKRLSQPKQKRMFQVIGVLLLILEIFRFINFLTVRNTTWFGALSFHLCSFGVYLAILTAIFQKKWMYDALLVFALIGAPLAIIIPNGILPWWHPYSFMPVQSFLSHMLITWVFIMGHHLKFWEPKIKNYWISISAVTGAYIIGYFASHYNHKHHTGGFENFIWTRYIEAEIPLINTWPYPHYLIFMFLSLLLVGFLYPLFFAKRKKN